MLIRLQMNPQHMIPTLDDNGVVLWESRAILAYLANRYGKTDSLYPKDPVKRARIDQKLFFDMGTLYQRFMEYYYPQIFSQQPADPEKYARFEEAMGFFDVALKDQRYATGDNLTIADLALIASVSTFELAGFPVANYPNVARWLELCKKTTPGYDLNEAGLEQFRPYFEAIKQK